MQGKSYDDPGNIAGYFRDCLENLRHQKHVEQPQNLKSLDSRETDLYYSLSGSIIFLPIAAWIVFGSFIDRYFFKSSCISTSTVPKSSID